MNILMVLGIFLLMVFIRYLVMSGVYQAVFYLLFKSTFASRILDKTPYKRGQISREIWNAFYASIVFAVVGVLMYIFWEAGHTQVYLDARAYPLWYMPISCLLILFLHDTYYYWLHRWMHMPRIYKYVHKVHHDSVHTSVWTSFSFHPLESLLQAIIIPVLILIIPVHIYVLLFILVFMTLSATINHAGVEIYPLPLKANIIGKWVIGATHHDHHHRKFLCNFGLYFTFWDNWMGTEKVES